MAEPPEPLVGGGDVACETALAIAKQAGSSVCLAYRGETLSRPKPANRGGVKAAVDAGAIRLLLKTDLIEVTPSQAVLRQQGEPASRIAVDAVFTCLGGSPPTELLQLAGVDIVTLRGERLAARA